MVGVLATKSSWQRLCSGFQGCVLDTGWPALSGIPFLSFPFLDRSVVGTSFWTTTVSAENETPPPPIGRSGN